MAGEAARCLPIGSASRRGRRKLKTCGWCGGPRPAGNTEKQVLASEIKGLKATGHLAPTGFVVLKGSQAVLKERASAHQYPYTIASRRRLLEDGTPGEDGAHLRFTRDAEFHSPSAAATVLHAGSANGLLAWKMQDGMTLKDLEAVSQQHAANWPPACGFGQLLTPAVSQLSRVTIERNAAAERVYTDGDANHPARRPVSALLLLGRSQRVQVVGGMA